MPNDTSEFEAYGFDSLPHIKAMRRDAMDPAIIDAEPAPSRPTMVEVVICAAAALAFATGAAAALAFFGVILP